MVRVHRGFGVATKQYACFGTASLAALPCRNNSVLLRHFTLLYLTSFYATEALLTAVWVSWQ